MIDRYGAKIRLAFSKSCLKQPDHLTYDYGHKVNVYIVYELGGSSSNDSDPTLKNCLFGAVTLKKMRTLKNTDILVLVLDSIEDQASHFVGVDLVKRY